MRAACKGNPQRAGSENLSNLGGYLRVEFGPQRKPSDVSRFRRAEELSAYLGLTPSQYSSAEKIRMGRITRAGKGGLRGTLVKVSWRLITKDRAMRQKYDRIKARAGGKRAIVAISRMLVLRLRRMLLDGRPYAMELAG
ncbi:MAG: transposase [Proteobacteria bacterium]|nr:transposase [Pseudomonadota bacterium]NIS70002.1 transposase [Pseudomonadota bacterium]